jgi:hypothetical protein
MEYYGVYYNKKKDYLIDIADSYDEGINLLVDYWFDGYDDCTLSKITKEEYDSFEG